MSGPSFAPTWHEAALQHWWRQADDFARTHLASASLEAGGALKPAVLNALRGTEWGLLCGDAAWGGHGHGMGALCAVLEALSAVHAGAASLVWAGAAAQLAFKACGASSARHRAWRDVSSQWLAWPAFHDIDEQLWPWLDGQGYLRGQADMLLGASHARWAVVPAQTRDQGIVLVLAELSHPAAIVGDRVRTLGLVEGGIHDVEFGGVPCEVLTTQGRACFAGVSRQLAPAVMAMQCGIARASMQHAHAHAGTRHQGGGPLLGWGEVRRMLSLMQERLSVMQGLLLASIEAPQDDGQAPHSAAWARTDASYAALHAGDLACEQTSDGLQLLGSLGYLAHNAQARRLCDARQIKGMLGGVAWRRQRLLALASPPVAAPVA